MSRMLQDHHSLQSCSDSSAVCRLLHCAVSTHWRQSTSHGRVFLQKEAALSSLLGVPVQRKGEEGLDLPAHTLKLWSLIIPIKRRMEPNTLTIHRLVTKWLSNPVSLFQ